MKVWLFFSEPLLGTFTHELTHAVSINMRNPFWKVIDSVFGDIFNPGSAIIMTTLFKEGAAVSMEVPAGKGGLTILFTFICRARQNFRANFLRRRMCQAQGTSFLRLRPLTALADLLPLLSSRNTEWKNMPNSGTVQ